MRKVLDEGKDASIDIMKELLNNKKGVWNPQSNPLSQANISFRYVPWQFHHKQRLLGSYAAGSMSEEDVNEFECKACPTCGSCSGMYTANSMNCLTHLRLHSDPPYK